MGFTYTTGLIATLGAARPVVVLDQGVQYPADTERRLDNVGSVFPDVLSALAELNGDQVLADLDLAVTDTRDVNDNLAVGLELLGKLATLLLSGSQKGGLDGLAVLLVERTELLLLNLNLPLLDDLGGLQALTNDKRSTGLLGVDGQIVRASVGTANALNPTGRGQKLSIPAVSSVMGHLVSHVLTETELGKINTQLLKEEVDASQEVAESLVVNDALLHSITDRLLDKGGLAGQLGVAVQKGELDVLDLVEAVVLLVPLGINEVLDLSHEELTDTEQTGTRGDFVTVGLANGGRGEGHVASVELQQLGKVEELALGGLGAQVAGKVAAGAN